MEIRKVTRWKASGLHLLLSVAIALVFIALLRFVWYPGPLFEAAGGLGLLLILVGVDVVAGPLITLIVFRWDKPGMKFDLAVIGTVQLLALLYGAHIMFLARPAYLVFVKDQFQVVTAVALEPEELEKARYPEFRRPPFTGPLLAFGQPPTDAAERDRVLNEALAGRDLENFPQYFVPYRERTQEVLARAWPLAKMRAQEPEAAKVVDAYLASSGTKEEDVRYLRMRAPRAWLAVLVDARTGEPVKLLIYERI